MLSRLLKALTHLQKGVDKCASPLTSGFLLPVPDHVTLPPWGKQASGAHVIGSRHKPTGRWHWLLDSALVTCSLQNKNQLGGGNALFRSMEFLSYY
jgi:hypothetical protein